MPTWQFTSPVSADRQQIRVFSGKFVVAGIGPRGQTRRLYAEFWKTSGASPVRLATSHAISTDTDDGDTRFWVQMFDVGTGTLDTAAEYQLRLFVAMPNDQVREVPSARLNRLTIRVIRFEEGVTGDCEPAGKKSVSVSHPAPSTTHKLFGFTPFGQVSGNGELVGPTSGSLNYSTPVSSNDGDTDPDGFWWVTFRRLTNSAGRTLTVTSNQGSQPVADLTFA